MASITSPEQGAKQECSNNFLPLSGKTNFSLTIFFKYSPRKLMGVNTSQTNLSQLQSAKALMYDALAGLLTYSPGPGLPIRWLTNSDRWNEPRF